MYLHESLLGAPSNIKHLSSNAGILYLFQSFQEGWKWEFRILISWCFDGLRLPSFPRSLGDIVCLIWREDITALFKHLVVVVVIWRVSDSTNLILSHDELRYILTESLRLFMAQFWGHQGFWERASGRADRAEPPSRRYLR